MEPLPSLPGIVANPRVGERQGGGRRDPSAFRRALQQEAGGAADGPPRDGGPAAEPAVRTALQPRPAAGRKDLGTPARHVDVLA